MQRSRGAAIWAVTALVVLAPAGVQAGPEENAVLPPWALTSQAGEAGILLTWNAPVGAVDGYQVYRADSQAAAEYGLAAFKAIAFTTDLAYEDAAYGGGGDPIFFVTAVRADAQSPPSNVVNGNYPYCWSITTLTDCFWPPPI